MNITPSRPRPRYIAALGLGLSLPLAALANGEAGLADLMAKMQLHSHKLQLSLDQGNLPLADFYAHELGEVIEDVQAIDDYDGKPIGTLTTSMLLPSFEQLEAAIDSGVAESAHDAFDTLVNTCNSCHVTTAHGAIRIQRNPNNPYLQAFEAAD